MKHINEPEYLISLRHVLVNGNNKEDRTNTGTRSIFGTQSTYYLRNTAPILTTKSIHLKSVIHELLWFLSGDTNIKYLNDNGVKIWDQWANENGDLGPVYGKQWRSFTGIDQIANVMKSLKENPFSRRHIVTAWNPTEVDNMALPPCHCLFQFFVQEVEGELELSCQLYQRSADMFLGVPFNIASYSILTHMIAATLGYNVGKFIHTIGDAHIYNNHIEQVEEQLSRKVGSAPTIEIQRKASIFDYTYDDIIIKNYNPQPAIKAPIAV